MLLHVAGNWTPWVNELIVLSVLQEVDWSCPSYGASQEKEDPGSHTHLAKPVETHFSHDLNHRHTAEPRQQPKVLWWYHRGGNDATSYGRRSMSKRLEAESACPATEGTFKEERQYGSKAFRGKGHLKAKAPLEVLQPLG